MNDFDQLLKSVEAMSTSVKVLFIIATVAGLVIATRLLTIVMKTPDLIEGKIELVKVQIEYYNLLLAKEKEASTAKMREEIEKVRGKY